MKVIDLVRFREALEVEILATSTKGGHPIVIRPGWVYGGRGGTAMTMYGAAKDHGVARHVGDGRSRWTTVHADDLAALYALALDRAPAGSIWNGVHGAPTPLVEIRASGERGGRCRGPRGGLATRRSTFGALGIRGRDRLRSGRLWGEGGARTRVASIAALDRR